MCIFEAEAFYFQATKEGFNFLADFVNIKDASIVVV